MALVDCISNIELDGIMALIIAAVGVTTPLLHSVNRLESELLQDDENVFLL